jgi:hypothetical protein
MGKNSKSMSCLVYGMALLSNWLTVFVEVPLVTPPVKTVNDLLNQFIKELNGMSWLEYKYENYTIKRYGAVVPLVKM